MFLFIFDLKMDYRIDAIMLITLLSKNYQMDGLQLGCFTVHNQK